MVIDVNLIKRQGKTEDNFSLEFIPSANLINIPSAVIEGACKVQVKVTLSGKKAIVEGEAVYVIKGECSRCLERATAKVTEPIFGEFSAEIGAENPIKSGKIDLTELVEEAIMTGSPMVIYCKEDCKGICYGCGVNLNLQACKCKN